MKKLLVLLGFLLFATLCFSQSTVYEVRMSQTMITTTSSATNTKDICADTADTLKTCGYEQVGIILGIAKESKECKEFYSKCDKQITSTCDAVEQSYNPKEDNFYLGLFCDLYESDKQHQEQLQIQIQQDTVKGVDRALQKVRKYYETLDIPLNAYPSTQPFK